MDGFNLLIVIPTRNRAEIAINAINSVLNQDFPNIRVVVSDNSTEEDEVRKVTEFCASVEAQSLSRIRPTNPLTMTEHWDWAIRFCLEKYQFSHVIFLTDRMVFKKNAISDISNVVRLFPEDMIVYTWDVVYDVGIPPTLYQYNWSGKLFRVDSSHLITESSRINFLTALPKMLNTCVPRFVVERLLETYGAVFSSVAPDYNFGYTALSMFDSVLFYDKTLLVSYKFSRSNGHNQLSGVMAKDTVDFLSNIKSPLSIDTPLPLLLTPTDAVLNEYFFAKEKTGSSKFPDVDRELYLLRLITDVVAFKDRKMRWKMLGICYRKLGLKVVKYHLRGVLPIRNIVRIHLQKKKKIDGMEALHVEEMAFASNEDAIEFARNNYRDPIFTKNFIREKLGATPSIDKEVEEVPFKS